MSTACMSRRRSISARISSVHGSAPKIPTFSDVRARVDALPLELVDDREHVRGRDHDHVGLEVDDQPHLALGHPARDRDHRAAEPLGAVVRPEPAGEEPVAVGDVDAVARAAAGGADRARDHVRPGVDVPARVPDDGRLPGRAAGGVDPHDPVERHGEHAERVALAQLGLGREREPREVLEAATVAGMDAGLVEPPPVQVDVVVRVPERPPEPLELERLDLVARRDLDRIERRRAAGSGRARRIMDNSCRWTATERWTVHARPMAAAPGSRHTTPSLAQTTEPARNRGSRAPGHGQADARSRRRGGRGSRARPPSLPRARRDAPCGPRRDLDRDEPRLSRGDRTRPTAGWDARSGCSTGNPETRSSRGT